MQNLPKTLRVLRAEHGYPQKVMADKLGMSIAQYSKIENGEKPLHIEHLIRLGEIFKLTPWALLEGIMNSDTAEGYKRQQIRDEIAKGPGALTDDGEEIAFYKKLATHYEQKYLELFRRFVETNPGA